MSTVTPSPSVDIASAPVRPATARGPACSRPDRTTGLGLQLRPTRHRSAPLARRQRIDVEYCETRSLAYPYSKHAHAAGLMVPLLQLDFLAAYRHPKSLQRRNLHHISLQSPERDRRPK